MSTIKVNAIQGTDGVERYTARAWVNFNGTGTVSIRASGNVSSIVDNGVGDYTLNFTSAMADANYASAQGALTSLVIATFQSKTASAFRIICRSSGGTGSDAAEVDISIFR